MYAGALLILFSKYMCSVKQIEYYRKFISFNTLLFCYSSRQE